MSGGIVGWQYVMPTAALMAILILIPTSILLPRRNGITSAGASGPALRSTCEDACTHTRAHPHPHAPATTPNAPTNAQSHIALGREGTHLQWDGATEQESCSLLEYSFFYTVFILHFLLFEANIGTKNLARSKKSTARLLFEPMNGT